MKDKRLIFLTIIFIFILKINVYAEENPFYYTSTPDLSAVSCDVTDIRNGTDTSFSCEKGKYTFMVIGDVNWCTGVQRAFTILTALEKYMDKSQINICSMMLSDSFTDETVKKTLEEKSFMNFPVYHYTRDLKDKFVDPVIESNPEAFAGMPPNSYVMPILWISDKNGKVIATTYGAISDIQYYRIIADVCGKDIFSVDYDTILTEVFNNDKISIELNRKAYNETRTDKAALDYFCTDYQMFGCSNRIKELALEITKNEKSDYEKLKAIHDWVADNIYYDYYGLNGGREIVYNPEEVLDKKVTVCSGYSRLTAALCHSVGIPCRVVRGQGFIHSQELKLDDSDKEALINHAWNEAYADGRWIIMDVTWDSCNKTNKENEELNYKGIKHVYFDVDIDEFSFDHWIIDQGYGGLIRNNLDWAYNDFTEMYINSSSYAYEDADNAIYYPYKYTLQSCENENGNYSDIDSYSDNSLDRCKFILKEEYFSKAKMYFRIKISDDGMQEVYSNVIAVEYTSGIEEEENNSESDNTNKDYYLAQYAPNKITPVDSKTNEEKDNAINKQNINLKLEKNKIVLCSGCKGEIEIKSSEGEVSYKSKNKSIATVSKYGVVKAKKKGSTDIVVTDKDTGQQSICKVKVNAPINKKKIVQKLKKIKKKYPEGKKWSDKTRDKYGNTGCYAYMTKVTEYLYGSDAKPKRHYSFKKIKVGDHIRIENGPHSLIVIEKKRNSVIVTEGNYYSSVHWGREITKSYLAKKDYYVETWY